MEIGKSALGALAALCVAAGAGGVYLVTRVSEPEPVETSASTVTLDPTTRTIEQSEAIAAERPETARPAARPSSNIVRRTSAARPAAAPQSVFERPPARSQAATDVPETIATPPAPEPVRPLEPQPEDIAEPLVPEFVELVMPSDSVLGLQVETSVTSERARVEDEVIARVTRDVRIDDRVAIPAGARAHGEVTLVERGGRLRERARLGVRFTSVVLADGTRIPLETETIYREGDAPGRESAAKIGGGAIGGAIIGGILGGTRGAVIGGSVGAGAGTAATLSGGRNHATLPAGTPVTVRLLGPTTVTVEKH